MRQLVILAWGVIMATVAAAATMEDAAKLFEARDWPAAAAAYREIVQREPKNAQAQFRLARASAAAGDREGALAALEAWIATGNGFYQAAMRVPELEPLRSDARFTALVEPLKPCNTPEFRQFDFWVGDWDVAAGPSRQKVGHNRITVINGGCTLREEYVTPAGYEGTSLSFYDAARKSWHQTWIDNQGGALYLEGGFEDGKIVMGTDPAAETVNRITWTPLPDGGVRHLWEVSADGGQTWSTAFDGTYSRRE